MKSQFYLHMCMQFRRARQNIYVKNNIVSRFFVMFPRSLDNGKDLKLFYDYSFFMSKTQLQGLESASDVTACPKKINQNKT